MMSRRQARPALTWPRTARTAGCPHAAWRRRPGAVRREACLLALQHAGQLAVSDDTARFQVNHAQVERSRQARDQFQDSSPVAPAVRHIDRTVEFLDLVTACHSFVAAAGRAVPGLRDRTLGEDERTIVHENVAKVRATLDWIETAVDTGKVDMENSSVRNSTGMRRTVATPRQ